MCSYSESVTSYVLILNYVYAYPCATVSLDHDEHISTPI